VLRHSDVADVSSVYSNKFLSLP